MVLVKNNKVKS